MDVTIKISRKDAERLATGMAELLCWTRGYMAGIGEDSPNGPLGFEEAKDMQLRLLWGIQAHEREAGEQ